MKLIVLLVILCTCKLFGSTSIEEVINEGEDCGCSGNLNRGDATKVEVSTTSSSISISSNEHRQLVLKNEDMVFISGGASAVGTDVPELWRDGEGPRRVVSISPFYIDKYEVPNAG